LQPELAVGSGQFLFDRFCSIVCVAMFQVRAQQLMSMMTPDGVRLDADVYYPDVEATLPVLLMRQPYGRAIASTVVYAHPAWYAAQGYIVVIQDVRGCGSSTGEFRLFEHEIADGAAAVEWAANLPGSNGCVGMYGFSYQGMTQLYAAVESPTALKTICPAMVGYDLYADWAYEGGAFCLQGNLGWALQLAALGAQRREDEGGFLALRSAAQSLSSMASITAAMAILNQYAPDSFYDDWLKRPREDEYWQRLSPKTYGQALAQLPMLHIGGWFDPFLRGTIGLYQGMAAQSVQPQQLIVGPWVHLPWGRNVGAIDYGAAAVSPCDRLQVRWFDYWLKGIDNGVVVDGRLESPVRLFEMGSKEWRLLDRWPEKDVATRQTFYLQTTGLTAVSGGELSLEPPRPITPQPDYLVHDPWRPVPADGCHAGASAGPVERSRLDGRSDVLHYTTEPLRQELHICGEIRVQLWCRTAAVSWDVGVVLADVHPSGQVYNFAQGYQRCERAVERRVEAVEAVEVMVQPSCMAIAKGHCLRLSVSAACFPAFAVNPGTGERPELTPTIRQQVISLGLESAGDRISSVTVMIG
jgi:uncharacterized protein